MSTRIILRLVLQMKQRIRIWRQYFQLNPRWSETLGGHWRQYGLSPNLDTNSLFTRYQIVISGFLIHLVLLIKSLATLCLNGFRHYSIAASTGDFFAFVLSKEVSWFYITVAHALTGVYGMIFYFLAAVQKQPDFVWFQVLEELKVRTISHVIDGNRRERLNRFGSLIGLTISRITPTFFSVLLFLFSFPYLFSLKTLKELCLGILFSCHYGVFGALDANLIAIQATYFLLLCLYVTFSLVSVAERITKQFKNTKIKFLFRSLQSHIKATESTLRLVRSCNNYFGQKLKLLLIFLVSCNLACLYVVNQAVTPYEMAFFVVLVIYFTISTAFFFLSASAVKRNAARLYAAVNGIQLKLSSFRLKWSLLLMVESLGSRRNRIGFRLKHWCSLNDLTFLKVINFLI